jgi:hypothetical protein
VLCTIWKDIVLGTVRKNDLKYWFNWLGGISWISRWSLGKADFIHRLNTSRSLVQTNLNPVGRFWWLKADSLRKEGKGRKPNRAQSISDEEERVNIFSVIHTLRYIMYFHNWLVSPFSQHTNLILKYNIKHYYTAIISIQSKTPI